MKCQSFANTTAEEEFNELSRPSSPGGALTEIFLDNGGISEIYHLATEVSCNRDKGDILRRGVSCVYV